jgi:hypothetical protein
VKCYRSQGDFIPGEEALLVAHSFVTPTGIFVHPE